MSDSNFFYSILRVTPIYSVQEATPGENIDVCDRKMYWWRISVLSCRDRIAVKCISSGEVRRVNVTTPQLNNTGGGRGEIPFLKALFVAVSHETMPWRPSIMSN